MLIEGITKMSFIMTLAGISITICMIFIMIGMINTIIRK